MMMIMKLQDQVTTEPRSSTRVCSAPEWYGNPVLEVMLLDHDEPMNYEESTMSPDFDKWLVAMKSEIGSMYENKVWTLVDLPNDAQCYYLQSSTCCKRFRQVQGIDYDETFSPVAMLKSV